MASKRKSTIPCMVPASETLDEEPDLDVIADIDDDLTPDISDESLTTEGVIVDDEGSPEKEVQDAQQTKKLEGGYECKYCTFETQDLNEFTVHVDSKHPNVILNPSYFCVECNFTTKRYDALTDHNTRCHSGELNFKLKMVKHNNQTIFEQTVEESYGDGVSQNEEFAENSDAPPTGISISKTPIMKMMKSRTETKRISVSPSLVDEYAAGEEIDEDLMACNSFIESNNGGICITQEANGTIIDSVSMLPAGITQVVPFMQSSNSNFVPKVMIPVNSIPTYNTNMDSNTHLVNSFNKFPYPTQSEVTTLKTQTKYAEEQIKIWFTAQRLKHGISWTPEEVEDAKKKLFNGTVHTVPQTITVIPAQISTAANGLQQILQPCQIVGQSGIVLTQVANSNAAAKNSSVTVTIAGISNQTQWQKRKIQESDTGPEAKRSNNVQISQLTSQGNSVPSLADPYGVRLKKTKEQLSELKASFTRNAFPNDSEIARIMQETGLSRGDIKKWFSDTRYNHRNSRCSQNFNVAEVSSTIIVDSGDETTPEFPAVSQQRKHGWNAFPDFTPQKFKEKTVEQLQLLEESFLFSPFPSDEEVNRLRVDSKLTRREIDVWFCERRKNKELEAKAEENGKNNVKYKDSEGHGTRTKSPYGQMHTTSLASGLAIPRVMAAATNRLYKKTPEQLHILKSAFVRTQWPAPEVYDRLAAESGLARTDIVSWFGDTRYAWKNGNLKWYYYYQSGNVESQNGQTSTSSKKSKGRGRSRGRPRGRGRGRSRGGGRSSNWSATVSTSKVSAGRATSGKTVLEDYCLKHKYLNEEDLDDLVSRSCMSYESIREWFVQRQTEGSFSESNNSDGQYPGDDEKNEQLEDDEDWAGEENARQEDEEDASDASGSNDVWKPPSQRKNEVNEPEAGHTSAENSNIKQRERVRMRTSSAEF
eukprot:gi/632965149/ref/XP_007898748.1/ PREDICTED: zinc fingers and homeoboxes protein 1 isoform X1 [Callorhinchus milii]